MSRRTVQDVAEKVRGLAHRPPETRKTTKDRSWEAAQRHDTQTTQVSYRGIPRNLNRRMKEIGQANGMNVSQVARVLLEHGLAAFENGDLEELLPNGD